MYLLTQHVQYYNGWLTQQLQGIPKQFKALLVSVLFSYTYRLTLFSHPIVNAPWSLPILISLELVCDKA